MHYLKLLTLASTIMFGTVVASPTKSNSDLDDPSGERNPVAWVPIPVDCDLRLQHDVSAHSPSIHTLSHKTHHPSPFLDETLRSAVGYRTYTAVFSKARLTHSAPRLVSKPCVS